MMSHGYCSMSEWFDVIYITESGCINYTRVSNVYVGTMDKAKA